MNSPEPRHQLAHLWPWQSVVGLGGVILNSAVFYAFIRERQNMARPVNVLVWWVVVYLHCSLKHLTMCRMQTLYCFLYSAISIHWRSYVMYTGTPLFFDLDVVNAISLASTIGIIMSHVRSAW